MRYPQLKMLHRTVSEGRQSGKLASPDGSSTEWRELAATIFAAVMAARAAAMAAPLRVTTRKVRGRTIEITSDRDADAHAAGDSAAWDALAVWCAQHGSAAAARILEEDRRLDAEYNERVRIADLRDY